MLSATSAALHHNPAIIEALAKRVRSIGMGNDQLPSQGSSRTLKAHGGIAGLEPPCLAVNPGHFTLRIGDGAQPSLYIPQSGLRGRDQGGFLFG
jgi:hypothetical protein